MVGGARSREVGSDASAASFSIIPTKATVKLDAFLVIPLTILYLLSFLDRSNIGNARVGGLQSALNMTDSEYSLAVTVTYIGHVVAELPANLLSKRIGPHIMLPIMAIAFGTITTLQGLVRSYRGLLVARTFLGLCEGGIPPGIVLYISSFYPRRSLQLRLAVPSTATSLAGAFSGLLATGILHMDGIGGLSGWAWIFILEGILSVVLAVTVAFVLPASIRAVWYLKPAEKEALESSLVPDGLSQARTTPTPIDIRQVLDALRTPHLWIFAPLGFFYGARLLGLAVFAPSIVNDLIGHHPIRAQLLTVPPYAVSFVTSLVAAIAADKWGQRGACCIMFSVISIVGYTISLTNTDERVNYFSIFLQTVGASGNPPTIATWTANNFAPHYKRATALAVVLMMSGSGAVLSAWIYTSPPRYTRPNTINLAFSVAEVLLAAVGIVYLRHLNAVKRQIRVASTSRAMYDDKEDGEHAQACAGAHELDDKDPEFMYYL